jgi:hypothetical protein
MINCNIQNIDQEDINNQLDQLNQQFSDYFIWLIDTITDLEVEEDYEKAAELMDEFGNKSNWLAFQFHVWKGTPIQETKEVVQQTFEMVYNQMKEHKKKLNKIN